MIKYTEKVRDDGKPEAVLNIDNGDLQALKDIMEQYGFIDVQALIRYALVALLRASDNKLYIKRDDDGITALNVSSELIKPTSNEV